MSQSRQQKTEPVSALVTRSLPVVLLLIVSMRIRLLEPAPSFSIEDYLMRFSHRPKSCATNASNNSISPHLIRIHLRHVIELVLKLLTGCILALTADFTNARDAVEKPLKLGGRELRRLCGLGRVEALPGVGGGDASFEVCRQVAKNGGEWDRVQTRESKLVDDMVLDWRFV